MKRWTELIVRIADLAEAEGRVLRETVRQEARGARACLARMGVGVAILSASLLLVLMGAGLVLAGLFLWLKSEVGTSGAAAISGALAIASGGALLWMFRKVMSS